MALPFSRDEFFAVFARYNDAIWPMQLVLAAIGVACVVAAFVRPWERAIAWALAALWTWMAVAYHFAFFTRINPAAWLFGALFLAAACLFAVHAVRSPLQFGATGARRLAGLALVAYALIGYPLLGWLAGQVYPRAPTFGLPCPTTIFTLGLLLLARTPVPRTLFLVPWLWSAIGTFAAIDLGVIEDYGLPVAAIATGLFAGRRKPVRARESSVAA
jgi:hypothetical protein